MDCHGYRICQGEKREVVEEVRMAEQEAWDNHPHMANFLQAVQERKPSALNCPIIEGHLSSALPHLANISYRTGRKLRFDATAEAFSVDEEANSYLKRDYRPPFVVPDRV